MALQQLPDYPWDLMAPYVERAKAHPDGAVDLSIGSPVDPTPELIRAALAEATDAHAYPQTVGTPALREAIVDWFSRRRGVRGLTVDNVLPTIGSKELVALLPLFLGLGEGDVVVHPRAAYPTYAIGAAIAGATAVTVASGAAATLELVAPATAQAGTAFSVTATVKDAFGNVADGYAGTLHVTSSDGAAALPADQTLTAGTGTLAVTLNTAGPQTVTATDTVTAALTAQASVNVTLRPVADLTIALTHSGSFTRGQTGTYLIDVTNSGTAATTVSCPVGAEAEATGATVNVTVAAVRLRTRTVIRAPVRP